MSQQVVSHVTSRPDNFPGILLPATSNEDYEVWLELRKFDEVLRTA